MTKQPGIDDGASAKPRLVALSAGGSAGWQRDAQLAGFFADGGFVALGDYQDGGVGEVPVRAFASADGTVNVRVFFLPGRDRAVVEFASAFADGECLVTTTAPITGESPPWVALRGVDAAVPVDELGSEHAKRLAAAEARAGIEALRIVELASHFELRGRANFAYDLDAAGPGGQAAADSADALWYYSLAGERRGPVTFTRLEAMARAGEFNASRDMAWMPAYPEWLRIREIPQLANLLPITKPASPPALMAGTWEGQEEVLFHQPEERFSEMIASRQDRGFGRVAFYLLSMVIIPAVAYAGHFAATKVLGDAGGAETSAALIAAFGVLIAMAGRLRNLAMSRAWLLALAVPVLNLWLIYRLSVCPAGYAEHKRLGAGGIFMAVVFYLWIAGLIAFGAAVATGKVSTDKLLIDLEKVPLAEEVAIYFALRDMIAQIPGGAIDRGVRYESGRPGWRSATFTYTLTSRRISKPGEGAAELDALMRPILEASYRSDPTRKMFRDKNVTMNYRYLACDGTLIGTIAVKP